MANRSQSGDTAQVHISAVVIVFPHPQGAEYMNFLQIGQIVL
jgi:hypothetical protein